MDRVAPPDRPIRLRGVETLRADLARREERRILAWALVAAIVVHVAGGLVRVPELGAALPDLAPDAIRIDSYLPPPPASPDRPSTERDRVRRVPIPDPTPDEPGSVHDPELDEASAPLIAGWGGVTLPELIPESYVAPVYPRVARTGRLEGKVVLRVIVRATGEVDRVEVLGCTRTGLGFEEAAAEAVRQWRYEPALVNGVGPVEAFHVITVEFDLDPVRSPSRRKGPWQGANRR